MPLWPLEPPPVVHTALDEAPLDLHEVHVYLADLDREAQGGRWDLSVVSPEERERGARMGDEPQRTRYLVGRAILRQLLSRVLEQEPSDVRFEPNTFGKPLLGEEWIALPAYARFNISHRNQVYLLAITGRGEIGVDVELVRPLANVERLATDHFTPAHARAVLESTPERKLMEFYRLWTLEEAIAKAGGQGVTAMGAARSAAERAPEPFYLVWQTGATVDGSPVIATVVLLTVVPGAST